MSRRHALVCDAICALVVLGAFVLLCAAPPLGWAVVAGLFILVTAGSM